MTVTLHLPPEKEAAFEAQARARGLTLEQWMLELAEQSVQPVSIAHLQRTDPEEWARQFDAWADSHDPNIPVLSDEAMSRESIYPDPTKGTLAMASSIRIRIDLTGTHLGHAIDLLRTARSVPVACSTPFSLWNL